jgi:hypothetical protein
MAGDAGNDSNDQERQQRELEELRRSFHEIGVKVGSFEPARDHGTHPAPPALPTPAPPPASAPPSALASASGSAASAPAPPPAKGRPTWVLALAAVSCLLLGGGLGYLLHRPAAPAAWPPPTAIVTQTTPPPPAKVVAPPACLQTAQRGDELIDLFTRNIRDRRLSLALKAYTLASQACRKEASP